MTRLIDEAAIEVKAGNGGNGHVSFRREKYVEKGGPDGGDGGKGGDVIIMATDSMGTLQDHNYVRHYYAEKGEHGRKKNQTGANGEDKIIKVPRGTEIIDVETGYLYADLIEEGDSIVIAAGGRGGAGNQHYATSRRQAPDYAKDGEPGEHKHIKLNLKLIADVGLVGFPNAGKSTLLSAISNATPKIASYPFTTLQPNLGVVKLADYRSYVVADMPGIIEDAHLGKGLGLQFLKHIQRTRILVFVLDGSNEDAGHDFQVLYDECRNFSETLVKKPYLIALNKIDLLAERPSFANESIAISAKEGLGLDTLIAKIEAILYAPRAQGNRDLVAFDIETEPSAP
jgi:GTPase